MKPTAARAFFSLTAAEGLIALGLFFARGPVLSTTRLGLLALAVGLEILLLAAALLFWLRPRQVEPRLPRLTAGTATALVTGLVFAALLIAGLLRLVTSPAAFQYDTYAPLFTQEETLAGFESLRALAADGLPLLAWFALALLQAAGLTAAASQPKFFQPAAAGKTLLALTAAALALAHWVILANELTVLSGIPGWYWETGEHLTSGSPLWAAAGLAALAAVFVLVLRRPQRTGLNLALLVLLGAFLQLSFGLYDGRGFEYLRLKYAGTLHKSYAMRASAPNADPLATIREYEALYGDAMFPSTKPPGVMVFYILTGKLTNLIWPQPTTEGRFLVLTTFAAYVFPLISFLVLIVLTYLARRLIEPPWLYLPALFYLTAPNVILLPLFLDQVLYPLLFTLGIGLSYAAVRRGTLGAGVLLGAGLYLAIFFSFSMLPLIPLALLLAGLDTLLRRKEVRLVQPLRVAAGMALGLTALFVLFYLLFGYDFLTRYNRAMDVVHYYDYFERAGAPAQGAFQGGFFPSLGNILNALALNNLDFAAGVGFPLYVFFLAGGMYALVRLLRGQVSGAALIVPAVFITFLALNLYGQNRGESSRLWLFWVPMAALTAALELRRLFRRPWLAAALLLLAQWLTILLSFKFQDFWM